MGDWKIVASAGTVVAASVPDAPNVLDTGGTPTTATVTYGMIGNASAFGFSWSISLPEAHADYAHLKKIHVVWVRSGHLVELATLYRPWASSPVTGDTGADPRWFQDESVYSDSVKFLCENDNGTITASPVTKSVTVRASTVTGYTSVAEVTAAGRSADVNRSVYCTVGCVPTLNGAQYPQNVVYAVSSDGTNFNVIGWDKVANDTQMLTCVRPVPATQETGWKFAAKTGSWDYNAKRTYTKTELEAAGFYVSGPFTVNGLDTPGTNEVSNIALSTIYNRTDPENGRQWPELDHVTWTDPTGHKTWLVKFYVRETDVNGSPANDASGQWHQWIEKQVLGGARTSDPGPWPQGDALAITYRAAGDTHHYLEVQCVCVNRNSTKPTDWNGSNTAVCVAQGAAIRVDFGTLPTPKGRADRFDSSTLGTNLTLDGAGRPTVPNALDGELLLNAGFDLGFQMWGASSPGATSVHYSGGAKTPPNVCEINASNAYIYQDFPAKAGQLLHCSVSLYANQVAAMAGGMFVHFYNESWVELDTCGVTRDLPAQAWYELHLDTPAVPFGTAHALITIQCIYASAGYFLIDNASVRRQPTTGDGTGPDGLGGVKGVVIGAPTSAGMSLAVNITSGVTTPAGIEMFGWEGIVDQPDDLTNYEGCELTVQYAGQTEGGSFGTLGKGQTTFHNGFYPRPKTATTITFRAYPISRDLQRGTPAEVTVNLTAAGSSTLDLSEAKPSSLGSQLTIRDGVITGTYPQISEGLINGGFEDGYKGWTPHGVTQLHQTPWGQPPPTGKYALTIWPSAAVQPYMEGDRYQCKPGERYLLKAKLVADPACDAELVFAVIWSDSTTDSYEPWQVAYRVSFQFPWKDFSGHIMTVPDGMSYFRLVVICWRPGIDNLMGAGNWSMDNIQVIKLAPVSPELRYEGDVLHPASDLTGNMLLNPDFRDGVTNWNNATLSVVSPHSDSQCGSVSTWGAFQWVKVKAGQQYLIESWLRTDAAMDGGVYIDYYAADKTTAVAGGGWIRLILGIGTSWQRVSGATQITPATAVWARVFGILVNSMPSGLAYFDDVAMKVAPTNGVGLGFDIDGKAVVKISGPLYTDVSGNLALRLAADFTVSGSPGNYTLSQASVNLALAVGFDTSQFSLAGGSFLIAALGVNKLIAGDALFFGDATFTRSGGGKVTLNSAGLALANAASSPTATVTITSSGVTIASVVGASTWSLEATSSGVTIREPGGAYMTAASGGIVIQKGSNSVTVNAGGVTIVGGQLTTPTITGGSLSITSAAGVVTSITQGSSGIFVTYSPTQQYSLLSQAGLTVVYGSNWSNLTAAGLIINTIACINGSQEFVGHGVVCLDYAVKCGWVEFPETAGNVPAVGPLSAFFANGATTWAYVGLGGFWTHDGSDFVELKSNEFKMSGFRNTQPTAGSKKFWYDPNDNNRVKFAP